jgi:hypothetical protein
VVGGGHRAKRCSDEPPPALYHVNLPHTDQVIGSNASVCQQANDDLVSLETRDSLLVCLSRCG